MLRSICYGNLQSKSKDIRFVLWETLQLGLFKDLSNTIATKFRIESTNITLNIPNFSKNILRTFHWIITDLHD